MPEISSRRNTSIGKPESSAWIKAMGISEDDRAVTLQNEIDAPLFTAFGVNLKPTWDDLQAFLKDRCVPQERDGLKYYLSGLGLDCYDPLAIIRKTEGRMAEDSCWIKIVEG